MAKTFDPSQLSPADQAAYTQWQQQFKAYTDASGGGVPAPVTYALAHPEYLQDHPELIPGWRIASGADLPPAVREATKGYHPVWDEKSGGPGFDKNSGLWSKWETYLQLGLAAAVAAPVVIPALAGGAAPAATGTAATGGSAAGTGAAGTAGGGAAAGGTGATAAGTGASYIGSDIAGTAAASGGGASALVPTTITGLTTPGVGTVATTPAFAAGGSTGAAATPSIWDKVFGKTTADKVLTGVGMGSNLVGNIIQSRQASKAAEAQEKAAAEALALQSNIYQQQRADLAPYRNAGASSLASLSYGLGLNPSAQADTTTPYFQQQAQQQNAAVPGQAQPRNPASLASLSGPVQLRAPNGQVKAVDPSQVQHYISMGATPV